MENIGCKDCIYCKVKIKPSKNLLKTKLYISSDLELCFCSKDKWNKKTYSYKSVMGNIRDIKKCFDKCDYKEEGLKK